MTSNADSDPRKGKEKRGAVGRSPLAKTEKEKGTATPATATPAPATARDWIGAARLRTLPLAIAPVVVGTGAAVLAEGLFHWVIALACLAVAVFLQIGVNYANDYSDGVRGTDDHRVGPARLTASGRVAPRAVLTVSLVFFALAARFAVCLDMKTASADAEAPVPSLAEFHALGAVFERELDAALAAGGARRSVREIGFDLEQRDALIAQVCSRFEEPANAASLDCLSHWLDAERGGSLASFVRSATDAFSTTTAFS